MSENDEKLDLSKSDQPDRVVGWGAASEVAGQAIPWLRRRLAKGLLQSERDESGQHTFARADLEALRPPAPVEPTGHAAPAPGSGGNGDAAGAARSAAGVDPEGIPADVYATIFGDLAAGKTLDEIVRERAFLPDVVERVAKRRFALQAVDLNAPSVPAEVSLLRTAVSEVRAELVNLRKDVAADRETIQRWIAAANARISRLVTDAGDLAQSLRDLITATVDAAVPRVRADVARQLGGFLSRTAFEQELRDALKSTLGPCRQMWPIVARLAPMVGLQLPPMASGPAG